MNRNALNKKLIFNTLLYFIANFSSKLLGFLLLPFYTSYLTPDDYGTVELVFTAAQFLTPVVTLQITHAVFRFLFETDVPAKQRRILSSAACIVGGGGAILILFAAPVAYDKQNIFILLGAFYIVTNMTAQFLQQALRGIGENAVFASMGVCSCVIQIGCNILFITGFGMRSISLLLAPILANCIIIVAALLYKRFYTWFSIGFLELPLLKKMIQFSAPLVPDAFIWWFLSGFGRFYLSHVQGAASLGIYAMANKFSDCILVLYAVFHMAWTENAYMTYQEKGRDEYFSAVFNTIMKFMLSAVILLLPLTRLAIRYMLGAQFQSAYQYIPVLYITVCFNLAATFYGSGLQCAKKTGGNLIATCISAVVNVASSVLLVGTFGIWGTVWSMLCANVALFLVKAVQSSNFFRITIIKRNYWIFLPLAVAGVFYYFDTVFIIFLSLLAAVIIFIYVNAPVIKRSIRLFVHMGKKV